MYASYWGMWMHQRLASQPVFYHNGERNLDQSLTIHNHSRLGDLCLHVALISVVAFIGCPYNLILSFAWDKNDL